MATSSAGAPHHSHMSSGEVTMGWPTAAPPGLVRRPLQIMLRETGSHEACRLLLLLQMLLRRRLLLKCQQIATGMHPRSQ